jgi:hypothetical protein
MRNSPSGAPLDVSKMTGMIVNFNQRTGMVEILQISDTGDFSSNNNNRKRKSTMQSEHSDTSFNLETVKSKERDYTIKVSKLVNDFCVIHCQKTNDASQTVDIGVMYRAFVRFILGSDLRVDKETVLRVFRNNFKYCRRYRDNVVLEYFTSNQGGLILM